MSPSYGSTDLGERKQLLLPLMLEREGRGDEHRVRLPPVDVHALAAPLSNIGWRGKWGVTGGAVTRSVKVGGEE